MPVSLPRNGNAQVAVVTGAHSFQVPPFYEVFRSLSNVDFYPQSLDEFTADAELALSYDVVLFYNMHILQPSDELPWYQSGIFSTLERLGENGQGICILHHALAAFPNWPLWDEIVGMGNRGEIATHYDQQIPLKVVDTQHPITAGISDWALLDETYEMASPREEDGNHLLLTTSHQPSMSGIAWTRTFRNSRVFCYQSGHDSDAFGDENFRRILSNAIQWLRI